MNSLRIQAPSPPRFLASAAVPVAFVVLWSSGFVGGRLGTEAAGTVSLLAWRFLLVVPLIGALLWITRAGRPRLRPRLWPREAVLGLLSQAVFLGGVIGAMEFGVSAGTSAIIAALQPLLAGALAGPILGHRVTAVQWVGLALGFGGVLIVVGGDLAAGAAPPWAFALPFLGMLGLVAATLLEERRPSELPPLEGLGVQCAASAGAFGVLAFATGQWAGPHVTSGGFWFAVAWLIVLSTFGGYGFYWLALRRTDVTRVSALLYLSPPTTVLWAWLMFGEAPTWAGVLGFAVCAVGVAVVFLGRRSRR